MCLGRLLNSVMHDPNAALVWISIVASAAAAGTIYALTDAWFGRRAAALSLLLFLFSPLCWFHGTVALTYIVEAFFSAAVGYCCWRSQSGHYRWVLPASVLLGLSAGFRPSSLLFLLPVWAFSLRRSCPRWIGTGCGVLALTLTAWFVPMVAHAGGFTAYASALERLWRMVPSRATIFTGSLAMSLARGLTMVWIYVLCFGAAAPLILSARTHHAPESREKLLFAAVWIAPGVLFFTFVFLLFVNSGYLLVLSPPLFAWLAGLLDRAYSRTAQRGRVMAVIAAACIANSAWFLCAPVYCSYRSVRIFERSMARIATSMRQRFNPADTIIIGFDSHFLGYRHAGYYLPEYLTVQYPEIRYAEGAHVFEMQNLDTRVTKRLFLERYKRFVLFPLPAGKEFPIV